MVRVCIIGVGRVGGALALALSRSENFAVTELICRDTTAEQVRAIAQMIEGARISSVDAATPLEADVVFITTRDAEIAGAAEAIRPRLSGAEKVFHTSGALDSTILAPLREIGCAVGSIHPLVSVSSAEAGPERFRSAYFCLETDEAASDIAQNIVSAIGGRSFTIDTQYKSLYHAAAVMACGHLVALFDASVELMSRCGIASADAERILLPLVDSTVRNLSEQGVGEALTGTFARADIDTFTRHLNALNEIDSEELLEIYLLLGERSLKLAARQGVSADRLDTLRTKVAIAKSKLKW